MSFQVITDKNFIDYFKNSDLSNYLDDIKGVFATLPLSAVQEISGDQYFNGENVSAEKLYSEFFPQLLGKLGEGLEETFLFIQDLEQNTDVSDYFDFLSENADSLFQGLRLDLNSEFSNLLELFNAYEAVMCHASTFENFVLIPENDFTDYMRDYGKSLEIVQPTYEQYFDWERFADESRLDYISLKLDAYNTLKVSGDCFMRC